MMEIVKSALDGLGVYQPLRHRYKRLREISRNLATTESHKLRIRLVPENELKAKLREAVSRLTRSDGEGQLGDYLEFGVYNGTSLSCMYEVATELGLEQMRFFGFDSFQGLPRDAHKEDGGIWVRGQFSCGIETTRAMLDERGVDRKRVILTKGFFVDTLNDRIVAAHGITKASIVMIDCDMYSSARTALRFIEKLIDKEAVVLFDDWTAGGLDQKNLGEKKAFIEFLDAHPEFSESDMGSYGMHSKVFHIVRQA
jgi:hypothetical protein